MNRPARDINTSLAAMMKEQGRDELFRALFTSAYLQEHLAVAANATHQQDREHHRQEAVTRLAAVAECMGFDLVPAAGNKERERK